MKTAYQLALERLEAEGGPRAELTDEQKQQINDINSRFQARMAEQRILRQGEVKDLRANGDAKQAAEIEQKLANELAILQEKCEQECDKVRQMSS